MEEDDSLCCTTELRLSLPGSRPTAARAIVCGKGCKRALVDDPEDRVSRTDSQSLHHNLRHLQSDSSVCKSSIVGWPPIRSQRKNNAPGGKEANVCGIYVKVSMDGAPFLRKIDLGVYEGYAQLLLGLENMFRISIGDYSEREGYRGSDYAPTYEDKDGDWMLVGDVPWDMFKSSCRRLRIMKGVEATGLGCGI